MPDKWEYPWFAAWDLAFHCVALAHVDPGFAKYQLILICREWFQHPNGALPAYEWAFDDVNPPVQAWAALQVFAIDGGRDVDFLSRVFDKLLVNFTWWVNLEDVDGNNLFEGGFLGLDNIGPIDRVHLPVGGRLQQSDATGWMALYSLHMATIAAVLNRSGQRPTQDLISSSSSTSPLISRRSTTRGSGTTTDGLFYDRIVTPDGTAVPVKVRSMVGVLPVLATGVVDEGLLDQAGRSGRRSPAAASAAASTDPTAGGARAAAGGSRRPPAVARRGWPRPAGAHLRQALRRGRVPVPLRPAGDVGPPPGRPLRARHRGPAGHASTTSRPSRPPTCSAETRTGGDRCGSRSTTSSSPVPWSATTASSATRSPSTTRPARVTPADARRDRPGPPPAPDLHLPGRRGRPAALFRRTERFQQDPRWQDYLLFNEYFHGDNGAGLGASHQTGWTGVVADPIRRQHGAVVSVGDVLRGDLTPEGRR